MTALVLRIGAVDDGRVREVPIGPDERVQAERLLDRMAVLESVRAGRRRVEIVPAGEVAR